MNGTAISQRTVDMIAKQAAASGRPDTPETRKAIIDQLALQMVVADEAVKKGLDKTPEVAEQLDTVKQSVLANAYVRDFVKNNPVSDDTVKAEYERIKATVTGTEYKARHILVEKESEAKDIIARLKKDPGAFAKLATERSKDPGSKAAGRRSRMVRSERDGAGIRRRRGPSWRRASSPRSRSRPSSATTSSCWKTRSRSTRLRWKRSSRSSPSSCSSRT